jgi:hypothetical protein
MPKPTKDDDSFLGRWSRKKLAQPVKEEVLPEPEQPPEPADEDPYDEELVATLPALDDLTAASDIRVFLQHGVPKALRNAALRRKWMLVPGIRDHKDPAVDYAWDWNTPGGVPGDGVAPSPEKVGQMLRDLIMPRHDVQKDVVAAVTQDDAAPDPVMPVETADDPLPAAEPQVAKAAEPTTKPEPTETPSVSRRRHGGALPS